MAKKYPRSVGRPVLETCEPVCVECGGMGKLASGTTACPDKPERATWLFYLCPCGAFVRCHRGTAVAMGRPAGPRTRYLRSMAHQAFDHRWRRTDTSASAKAHGHQRKKAYAWLSRELGIRLTDCHIGRFDAETCQRVIDLCADDRRKAA